MADTKTKPVTCPECYERFEVTYRRPQLSPGQVLGRALAHGILFGAFTDCSSSAKMQRVL